MSLSTELERLQKKKVELKNQLHSIEGIEETLMVRMKVLEEKMAVQVLEQWIQAKLAFVEELKSNLGELENRLKVPQQKPETSQLPERRKPEVAEKVEVEHEKEPMEVMIRK